MNPVDQIDTRCLRSTIGNPQWFRSNYSELIKAIPREWTSVHNLILPFGFAIKILGVEWRQEAQVALAIMWLNHLGIAESRIDPHGAKDNPMSLIVRRSLTPPDVSRFQ